MADSLRWAGGDLGLVSDPPADGRRLDSNVERPEALTRLLSTLVSFGIGMGVVCALQVVVTLFWKYRANRKYYRSSPKKLTKQVQRGTIKSFEELSRKGNRSTPFRKFPIIFVFPSVFLIVFKLFATSLAKNSASLLATPTGAGDSPYKTLAGATLGATIGFAALGWFILIDFNNRFRESLWKPSKKPATASKVDDPFYRGVSLLRAWCCGKDDARSIITRSQGKFSKPKRETFEPARTERLLKRPLSLYKGNAADVLEAYQFAYFPLSAGKTSVSLFFNLIVMTAQLVMAILCGIGSSGNFDQSWGRMQVQCMLSVQWILFAYVWCLFPAHDRGDNLMFSAQFLCEGVATAMLFTASETVGNPVSQSNLRNVAFFISLGAVAVPLLRRFYDGVIVQCVKVRRKGPFNRQAAAMAFFLFVMQLQVTILKLLGMQSAEVKSATSSTAIVAKVANREVASGMRALVESGLELNAEAYGMLYQTSACELDAAATKIQSHARVFLARKRAERLRGAIEVICSWLRALLTGRQVRRQLTAFHRVKLAAWAPREESFGDRPGYVWLQREEAMILARERIDRLRATQRKVDVSVRKFSRDVELGRVMQLLQDPSKLHVEVHRFKPKARSTRAPPPQGMPPQLLAPPTIKPMTLYALSSAAFDRSEMNERASIAAGEPSKQRSLLVRGRQGLHEVAGLLFSKSSCHSAIKAATIQDTSSSSSDVSVAHAPSIAQQTSSGLFSTGIRFFSSAFKMVLGYGLVGTSSFPNNSLPSTTTGRMVVRSKDYALQRSKTALQEVYKLAAAGVGFGGVAATCGLSAERSSASIRRRRKDDEEDGADEEGDDDAALDDGGD